MGQLEDMDVFVRIAEAGNISRAADQMGIVKSALSRRLSELEGRLGTRLIARTTRQSSLTDAGRTYYHRARQILGDVEDLNTDTSDTDAILHGTLSVSVPLTFGLSHLASLVTEFAARHPALDIQLDFADRQVNLVEEGFDMAVRIADLPDSSMVARKLTTVRHVLCASRAYLDTHGTPTEPSDLKNHQALLYANAPRQSWTFTGPDGKRHSVRMASRIRANNGDFLCDAAVAGIGLAIMPTFVAWRSIEKGDLVAIMRDFAIDDIHAYAIYPETRHVARRVRAFIDFLADQFTDDPYWDDCLRQAPNVA